MYQYYYSNMKNEEIYLFFNEFWKPLINKLKKEHLSQFVWASVDEASTICRRLRMVKNIYKFRHVDQGYATHPMPRTIVHVELFCMT